LLTTPTSKNTIGSAEANWDAEGPAGRGPTTLLNYRERHRETVSAVSAGISAPRRIDTAVAAVMAHDRAAALAGSARDSIYI
jgi:hypothetical protein